MKIIKEISKYFRYLKQRALDRIVIPFSEVHCETRFKSADSIDVEVIITLESLPESDALDNEQLEWYNSLDECCRVMNYPAKKENVKLIVENHIKYMFYKKRRKYAWENQ